jgi:hypothetical protein
VGLRSQPQATAAPTVPARRATINRQRGIPDIGRTTRGKRAGKASPTLTL